MKKEEEAEKRAPAAGPSGAKALTEQAIQGASEGLLVTTVE